MKTSSLHSVPVRDTIISMISSFRHRGLKRLFERGDRSRVRPDQLRRIEDILARLDIATSPDDLDLPGYRMHALKGDLDGFWSLRVSGNWRITYRLVDGEVHDVDLIDYH